MTLFLMGADLALFFLGLALMVLGHRQSGRLALAAANGCGAVADFLHRNPVGALCAVACAYCLWLWWHNGGGDGTKRRLRRLRERFTPVRRTAPAAAMAVTS